MSDSCDPMVCSPSDSSVHGISQAILLEWVAISFSKGSSWLRDWTPVSCIGRRGYFKYVPLLGWQLWRKSFIWLFVQILSLPLGSSEGTDWSQITLKPRSHGKKGSCRFVDTQWADFFSFSFYYSLLLAELNKWEVELVFSRTGISLRMNEKKSNWKILGAILVWPPVPEILTVNGTHHQLNMEVKHWARG